MEGIGQWAVLNRRLQTGQLIRGDAASQLDVYIDPRYPCLIPTGIIWTRNCDVGFVPRPGHQSFDLDAFCLAHGKYRDRVSGSQAA
jgi:hypothetical protein